MIGNQNSTENLRFLAAQRQLYIEAKFIGKIRFIGSLIVAIGGAWLSVNYPEVRVEVSVFSAFWIIIVAFILKKFQKEKVLNAATIQEEFDICLFGLPWNKILVGNKVAKEIVIEADRGFKGDRDKLRDWYPDVSKVHSPMDVLLCQRANLLWDWRLRRKYAWALGLTTLLFVGLEIAFCWNKTVSEFFTQYFIPALPVLIIGYENITLHSEIASKKECMEKSVTSLYEEGTSARGTITLEKECRQIQDFIYMTRTKDALIPEFWSAIFRTWFQSDMEMAAIEYQKTNNSR